MKRRALLIFSATVGMLALAALARQRPANLLVLEWASKAKMPAPPVAVLIEFGVKDGQPTAWAGRASVEGARVVHREGYRFRAGDKLVEPDGWIASSHRAMRVPPRNPAVAKMEGIATVGVVLHLADMDEGATLRIEPKDGEPVAAKVSLRDVVAGRRVPLFEGRAVVRRISTATPVVTARTEDDFPTAAYGPDGTLWVAYISYHVKEDDRRIESQPLEKQPSDFRAYFTPEFGDQVFVKCFHDGQWSEPLALTGPKEDLVRCAVAAEKDGRAWIAYSASRQGGHNVFARPIQRNPKGLQAGEEVRVSSSPREEAGVVSFLSPVMCTDPSGKVFLACQCWDRQGRAGLGFLSWHPENRSHVRMVGSANAWHATLSAGRKDVTAAWDEYSAGDYDVGLLVPGLNDSPTPSSSRFEARPSIAHDAQGRLWIAYEEGPVQWGKDYGAQDSQAGNPLYNERSVRVVCLVDGKLHRPVAELPTARFEPPQLPFEAPKTQGFERATRYSSPQIGLDGKGRVWIVYRQKFGSRYSSHPGSYWLSFARRLDGDRWSEPIELHHSDGLLDHRPVLLPHPAGGLIVVHNTDGRYSTPETIDNQIYLSVVDLPGDPVEPKLVPHDPGKKDEKLTAAAKREAEAVRRIRDYRVAAGGKTYQLLRGEFHRHTEISWDGGPDGSLEDMFRYGIDAAAMDWIGNGDHDNGGGREYSWWLIQKLTDAYHVPGRFTPMFTYERSVPYPHGHRNCVFVKRGVRTLPRLAEPDMEKRVAGVHADDTKMLYRYLRELDGICAVHTSATSMGTDWRDNDPVVEPIVEIYQGDRMSYEIEGAPRAGYDAKSGKTPVNVAGWFPLGFINHAFAKGYKLGFQASSDHWSTHISYCIVLAEKHDRQAILDAMKRRHCYGATDDIILDVRSGPHVMGDAFKSATAPALQVVVVGTAPLAAVEVLRDSKVVATLPAQGAEFRGAWTDPAPSAGEHYYYVRVRQADDELAWSSPLWIDYQKP
jgi:hypothetical protein